MKTISLLALPLMAGACSGAADERAVPAAWAERFPLFVQAPAPRDTLTPPPVPEGGRYAVQGGVSPLPAEGAGTMYWATVGSIGLDGFAPRPRQLCLVGARLWPQARGIAGPPVWSSIGRGEVCATQEEPGYVRGAAAHRVSAAALLGDSLGEGWFLPVVRVRSEGRVADVPGQPVWVTQVRDTASPASDLRLLRYRATTQVLGAAPPTLLTTVQLSVAGPRPVRVEGGGCGVTLLAYRTPERTGTPAWDSRRRDVVCGLMLLEYVVGRGMPRDRLTFQIPVPEMLGDSLGDGVYYFKAIVTWQLPPPLEGQPAVHETAVEVPAGEARISARVPPLSAQAAAGPFSLRARTDPVAGRPGTFLTTLTVTNRTRGAEYLASEYGSPCAPFGVYRSRGDRERAVTQPWVRRAWDGRGCVIPLREQWLAPGESRTFGGRFTARTVLGDTLPPGRYFFLATLFPGSRDPQRSATLAAGDAVLERR